MFEDQSYETILQRMLDRVSDGFDKREGSVIWDTHSPTALEFQNLYLELENILQESFGDTASREYLIKRAKERGLTPTSASKAVLKGVFTPSTVDVKGKRFNLSTMNYTVGEKIEDGVYKVECETVGAIGNQYFGTITPIDYVEGLETAQLVEVLIPGEDEESTESLRKRYFASFSDIAYGGNKADYIAKTNSISGVGATKVTRVWNSDIKPAKLMPSDAVKTWYSGIVGSLSEDVAAWLTPVYTAACEKKLTTGGTVKLTILNSDFEPASDTLINTVQTEIDPEQNAGEGYGIAPIGHVVNVESAEGVSVTVKTNITFDTGYSWDTLQDSIDEVIESYLLGLRKAWADVDTTVVRISQIEARITAITGVIDIQDTTLNGKAENLLLTSLQVPLYGGASE